MANAISGQVTRPNTAPGGKPLNLVAFLLTALSVSTVLPAQANVFDLGQNYNQTYFSSGKVLMSGSGGFFPESFIAHPGPPSIEFGAALIITGYWDNTDQYQIYDNGVPLTLTPSISSPPIDYGDTYGTFTTPAQALPYPFCVGQGCGPILFSQATFNVNFGDVITIQDVGPLYYDVAASAVAGTPEYDAQFGITFGYLVGFTPEPSFYVLLSAGLAALFFFHRRRTRSAS